MLLKKGSTGETVKKIQRFLSVKDDGIFGGDTEKAVIKYQKSKGLVSDGKVGKNTLNKMVSDGLDLVSPVSPVEKPQEPSGEDILEIIKSNEHALTFPPNTYNSTETTFDYNKHLIVVAIRGYKLEIGSNKSSNDRGIYDDSQFIYTPNGVISFPGNTDPSGYRKGQGTGSSKGMACLDEGVWAFNKGLHKGRLGFRQVVPFRVIRDGSPPYPHTGWHAINWHNGNQTSTSSLGCQTNPPDVFNTLRVYIYNQLELLGNPKMKNDHNILDFAFPYILIDEINRRKGNLVVA